MVDIFLLGILKGCPKALQNILLITWWRDLSSGFTLKDCLFEGVKLVRNADPDIYVHTGYVIGINLRSEFSLPSNSMAKNVIILLELIWAHLFIIIIRVRWYCINRRSSIFN